MKNDNIVVLNTPAQDVLSELLKTGAQQLLTQAIEAEVATLLAQYQGQLTESGLQGVVRNGHLPERTIQLALVMLASKYRKETEQAKALNLTAA